LCPESNIKTKTFRVHAGNCYNCCLRRASVLGGCSKDVTRRQQSFCRQMCCASVEQHTICRWTSGVDVLDLPKPSVCSQPSTEVPGRTKTSKRVNCEEHAVVQLCSCTCLPLGNSQVVSSIENSLTVEKYNQSKNEYF